MPDFGTKESNMNPNNVIQQALRSAPSAPNGPQVPPTGTDPQVKQQLMQLIQQLMQLIQQL